MARIKYSGGKPCRCGCGQPAKQNIGPDGRNRGWYKFAEGHQPPRPLCDPAILAKAQAAKYARIPIGARRIHTVYGKQYWEIKVAGRKRWVLEHRWIMEQRLGRPLERREHVHHRDDDGLNNGLHADGEDNLEILTGSAHRLLHEAKNPTPRCRCKCPHCGKVVVHFRRSGKKRRDRRR
jgi:hypothetical protein